MKRTLEFPTIIAVLFSLAVLFAFTSLDARTVDFFHPVQSMAFLGALHALSLVGEMLTGVVIALLLLALPETRRMGLTLVLAGLVGVILVLVLKTSIARPRPFGHSSYYADLPLSSSANNAFPSGHASRSFIAARVFTHFHKKLFFLFYGFAILIAFSRVALGMHYPSDVFAGAALGYSIGWFFTTRGLPFVDTVLQKLTR